MLQINNHKPTSYHKYISSFAVIATLILFSLPATSRPFTVEGRPGEVNLERMAERLELSEQQKADIMVIRETGKTTGKPAVESMQANRETLETIINSDNPDQDQIQLLAEAQGNLLTEVLLQKADMQQQINAVLNSEQRIKMQAYKDAHHDMRAAQQKHRRPPH